jgi:hypothetical protein
MGNTDQDAMWVDNALQTLPTVPVPAGLESRILADFDALAARRRASLLGRLRDAVWPGAPAWRPAFVFGAALALGLMAGVLIPIEDSMAEGSSEQTAAVSLDAPPAFEIGESS